MANVGFPQPPQNQPIENPVMGLFLDRPASTIDPKGFSACNNVRIELGRVRSDLVGWAPSTFASTNSSNPFIYLDSFTNSAAQTIEIGVTPTDILSLQTGGASHKYITPTYTFGTIAVNNGANTVAGTNTRWNTDIQFGVLPYPSGDFALIQARGTDGLSLIIDPTVNPVALTWQTGLSITMGTGAGSQVTAIPPGTYINNIYLSTPTSLDIKLSQPCEPLTLGAGVGVYVGNGLVLRKNVRQGDQIAFGTASPGVFGPGSLTWYTVTAVGSDSSLTISPPYSGANLSGSPYVIRQLLTNTLTGGSPYIPGMSSDSMISGGGFGGYPAFHPGGSQDSNIVGGDEWFFTNGIDPVVVYYSSQNTCLFSRTVPFIAKCLKQFRGLLVYGGLTAPALASPVTATQAIPMPLFSSITSSDSGFPQQLNTGVAFQGIATSGPFTISHMAILGSALMLYGIGPWAGGASSSDTMSGVVTSASFVGYPTIWSFSDVIKTRGPISSNAVVVFGDRHQFISIDGEYRYNGLFIQVMNDHVWREVLKNFDITRPNACFSYIVPTFGDVVWAVPLITDPAGQKYASTAYVEHYMEQANSYLFKPFSQRDFPFACAGAYQLAGTQPSYFAGDLQGNIWQLYTASKQNGVAALATVTWASRKIGNGRNRVLVTRVYPEIEYEASPVANVNVTLTLQDATAGPVTITDTQSFNPSYPSGLRFTTHYRRGRQASVTISDQAGVGWVCDGYDWDFTEGGLR